MTTTYCLDCERIIDLGPEPVSGQRVKCPSCEVVLEIINTDPLELDWIYDGPTTWSNVLNKFQGPQPTNTVLGQSI